jgi:hypothetical protein
LARRLLILCALLVSVAIGLSMGRKLKFDIGTLVAGCILSFALGWGIGSGNICFKRRDSLSQREVFLMRIGLTLLLSVRIPILAMGLIVLGLFLLYSQD